MTEYIVTMTDRGLVARPITTEGNMVDLTDMPTNFVTKQEMQAEIARLRAEAAQAEQNWAADYKRDVERLEDEIARLRAERNAFELELRASEKRRDKLWGALEAARPYVEAYSLLHSTHNSGGLTTGMAEQNLALIDKALADER